MPDAKSLLPGRAFRSEHAQLRPEPHSIASHGPAPMDPLQTTRMRNGVLYAAEWPCCHDPLRLSLGSEDPFSQPTRSARAVAHPLQTRVRARRARRVRAPPPRAGRRAPNASTQSPPSPLPSPQPREIPRRCESPPPPPTPRASGGRPGFSSPHAQALGCVLRPHRQRARACATPAARPEPTSARNCRARAWSKPRRPDREANPSRRRALARRTTDRPRAAAGSTPAARTPSIRPPPPRTTAAAYSNTPSACALAPLPPPLTRHAVHTA